MADPDLSYSPRIKRVRNNEIHSSYSSYSSYDTDLGAESGSVVLPQSTKRKLNSVSDDDEDFVPQQSKLAKILETSDTSVGDGQGHIEQHSLEVQMDENRSSVSSNKENVLQLVKEPEQLVDLVEETPSCRLPDHFHTEDEHLRDDKKSEAKLRRFLTAITKSSMSSTTNEKEQETKNDQLAIQPFAVQSPPNIEQATAQLATHPTNSPVQNTNVRSSTPEGGSDTPQDISFISSGSPVIISQTSAPPASQANSMITSPTSLTPGMGIVNTSKPDELGKEVTFNFNSGPTPPTASMPAMVNFSPTVSTQQNFTLPQMPIGLQPAGQSSLFSVGTAGSRRPTTGLKGGRRSRR